MAVANGSLLKAHLPNPSLSHLFTALDPFSLIVSHFPTENQKKPNLFHLTTENFTMERGPRYDTYARLRESKLRSRSQIRGPEIELVTPIKKQGRLKGCSVLAQSVPDFAEVVRKENRKPLPPLRESPSKTPGGSKGPKLSGVGAKPVNSVNSGGKSVNLVNSGGKSVNMRKSYATMEELKGFSISGGERRGAKKVLGYKKY